MSYPIGCIWERPFKVKKMIRHDNAQAIIMYFAKLMYHEKCLFMYVIWKDNSFQHTSNILEKDPQKHLEKKRIFLMLEKIYISSVHISSIHVSAIFNFSFFLIIFIYLIFYFLFAIHSRLFIFFCKN